MLTYVLSGQNQVHVGSGCSLGLCPYIHVPYITILGGELELSDLSSGTGVSKWSSEPVVGVPYMSCCSFFLISFYPFPFLLPCSSPSPFNYTLIQSYGHCFLPLRIIRGIEILLIPVIEKSVGDTLQGILPILVTNFMKPKFAFLALVSW